jgi:hypothetical protein
MTTGVRAFVAGSCVSRVTAEGAAVKLRLEGLEAAHVDDIQITRRRRRVEMAAPDRLELAPQSIDFGKADLLCDEQVIGNAVLGDHRPELRGSRIDVGQRRCPSGQQLQTALVNSRKGCPRNRKLLRIVKRDGVRSGDGRCSERVASLVQQLLEGRQRARRIVPKQLHERSPSVGHRSGGRRSEQELVRDVGSTVDREHLGQPLLGLHHLFATDRQLRECVKHPL